MHAWIVAFSIAPSTTQREGGCPAPLTCCACAGGSWSVQVQDIVGTSMPAMAFALRVRVSPYPEGVLSIWMMLAVKYCATAPPGGR